MSQTNSKKEIQKNSPEQRFVDILTNVEARAEGESSARVIAGYGAIFNSWSNPIWWFKEQVAPGAFEGADFSRCIACFNHDVNTVMARYSAGTLKLSVDGKGLYFEFEVPNTTVGNDLYENIRLGNISQCSFKFIVEEDAWKYAEDENQLDERTITKISTVLDVSPVVYPAYEDTSLEARSFEALEQKKQDFLNQKNDNNIKADCESRDRICQMLALGSKF